VVNRIKEIRAREVFTIKGQPTIEVDVILQDGSIGRAAALGGTLRSWHEPRDITDGDPTYFNGMGVRKAIRTVSEIIGPWLKSKIAYDLSDIYRMLIAFDRTPDSSLLGGNCIIATSIACAKATACSKGIPLFDHFEVGNEIPLPFVYVMFGGPAYVGAEGICDFQEYDLVPLMVKNYKTGYISTLGIYKKLCEKMTEKKDMVVHIILKLLVASLMVTQFKEIRKKESISYTASRNIILHIF